MRKTILAISALALPLAACAQEEEDAPQSDSVIEDVEEPEGDSDDEGSENEGSDDEASEDAEGEEADVESSDEDEASE